MNERYLVIPLLGEGAVGYHSMGAFSRSGKPSCTIASKSEGVEREEQPARN